MNIIFKYNIKLVSRYQKLINASNNDLIIFYFLLLYKIFVCYFINYLNSNVLAFQFNFLIKKICI